VGRPGVAADEQVSVRDHRSQMVDPHRLEERELRVGRHLGAQRVDRIAIGGAAGHDDAAIGREQPPHEDGPAVAGPPAGGARRARVHGDGARSDSAVRLGRWKAQIARVGGEAGAVDEAAPAVDLVFLLVPLRTG